MRNILLLLLFFCHFSTFGQLQENFADGNFTQNPIWSGDNSFFVVNTAGQLQSNGPALTGTELQLVTPCQAVTGTTWEFWVRLNLATSSGNYADVFLLSDSANLKGGNRGYFVRLGGTPDEVSLFRKDGSATPVYVINGQDGRLGAATNNVVRVKVTRDGQSGWQLFTDVSGSGQHYTAEGSAVDATYQRSRYFGVLLKYTAANNRNFFFDDFIVTDPTPPSISNVRAQDDRTVVVQFNEPVSPTEAQQTANFNLNNSLGNPIAAVQDVADPALVRLQFARAIPAGTYTLTVTNQQDLYGNRPPVPLSLSSAYAPPVVAQYREVRINEIMADFNPPVGLPEAEYLELYNSSPHTFNLQGWQYADATTARGILPAYQLPPGSYVILCRAADTAAFRPYGPVLGLTTFPSLNDAGDEVRLFDPSGKLIDQISYTTAWYRDSKKAAGGWSLELINPTTTCGGDANWIASTDPKGGTPGKVNSVYSTTPDTQPPALLQAEIIQPNQVKLTFSEPLDTVTARTASNYSLAGGIAIIAATLLRPALREVLLSLAGNLSTGQVYELTIRNLKDCAGNTLATPLLTPLVLPEAAAAGDVVINEVLFNPRSGGVDFVELVNRSEKYISLAGWQLGNIRPDSASEVSTITTQPLVLAPQQYLVLTTRPEVVQAHYPAARRETFYKMSRLPSYPDDQGTVLLLDAAKKQIDRFDYTAAMHFKLLNDLNGVSLERIRLQGDSGPSNWHSAASTVGYATPGYQNSQYQVPTPSSEFFTIEPKLFTPDGDGHKDFATINYHTAANGYVTNITIYDAGGREVKRLVKNELLAREGFFQWDGTDARGRKAAVGHYILYIELFNLKGQVKAYKETVVVGARF